MSGKCAMLRLLSLYSHCGIENISQGDIFVVIEAKTTFQDYSPIL